MVGGSGGVWNFPVQLLAAPADPAPADPDDIIVIEAAGLNKESQVQFRLSSLQEYVHNNVDHSVMQPLHLLIPSFTAPSLFLLGIHSHLLPT